MSVVPVALGNKQKERKNVNERKGKENKTTKYNVRALFKSEQ